MRLTLKQNLSSSWSLNTTHLLAHSRRRRMVRSDSAKKRPYDTFEDGGFRDIASDRTELSNRSRIVAISDNHLLLAPFSGRFFFFVFWRARRIRLRIINVSRKIQRHLEATLYVALAESIRRHTYIVHHYIREHRVCRFVGRNRSKAPSWRFCILFVGITIEYILSLPSLKTVAAWYWSVSLLNLYSIPPLRHIEKAARCPMNFIETKVYTRTCERKLFHFMRHDIVLLLHFYTRFLPVSLEMLFRKNALFSCQEFFPRIYMYFQNFSQSARSRLSQISSPLRLWFVGTVSFLRKNRGNSTFW